MRIHSGEKTYKRKVCFKDFSQLSQFNIHIPIHTDEKPQVQGLQQRFFTNVQFEKLHV